MLRISLLIALVCAVGTAQEEKKAPAKVQLANSGLRLLMNSQLPPGAERTFVGRFGALLGLLDDVLAADDPRRVVIADLMKSAVNGTPRRAGAKADAMRDAAKPESDRRRHADRVLREVLTALALVPEHSHSLRADVEKLGKHRDPQVRRRVASLLRAIAKSNDAGTRVAATAMVFPVNVAGRVTHVGPRGRLLTVELNANPARVRVAPGSTFAIHRHDKYKAEVRVTAVKGGFAFCRVTGQREGAKILVGDLGSTNLR